LRPEDDEQNLEHIWWLGGRGSPNRDGSIRNKHTAHDGIAMFEACNFLVSKEDAAVGLLVDESSARDRETPNSSLLSNNTFSIASDPARINSQFVASNNSSTMVS
jgi:hypothetical protein